MISTPAIEVRSLAKTFGAVRGQVAALHDVTFDVQPGSALAIVGENGSGKSTLLDALLGLTPATSGSVRIAGETAALLELGAGFFHELTGRENAMQLALLSGASSTEARALVARSEEFAEIGAFFDCPVRTYSAGMLMRLGFAIASNLKAPVVIIDEVLAVGDGYFQRKCIQRLVEMRRDHTTLVIAAHDLHALRGLCDQALWLQGGRVAALGPVDVVLSGYEDHLRKRSAASAELPGTGGTGEVVIRNVRLTDAQGAPRVEFRSG